jgi:FO synthase
VRDTCARAHARGCPEARFCLGDRPEAVFASYRELLASWGFTSTVDYLVWACQMAIDAGLSPHTNAGVLSKEEMARLAPVNASMGLMLESLSETLCNKGGPHHRAPDKHPAVRLQMHEDAGALGIPFTSGILVGIGESEADRVLALEAIRDTHRRHGHVREVIVQRFRAHPDTPMALAREPADEESARAIALARLIVDDDVRVQAPPNLTRDVKTLLDAGVDDLGGISPVTPDYINREYAWPHLDALAADCAAHGFALEARLP